MTTKGSALNILLLSDTHGHLDDRIVAHAAEADEIWHAGDVGSIEVVDRLMALGYVLWLEWFVTRAALGVPGLQAAGFVVIDVALSLFIAGLVSRLSAG